MRNRKLLSLIMVITLFFSKTIWCTWSWWENIVQKAPIQSITQSIDKETTKKLSLVAIAAATLMGLYYWMSKKSKKVDEKPVLSAISYNLEQYQVYNQFDDNGGGSASCGYHALLRSLQLIHSKSSNKPEATLKNDLMSPDLIQVYFGNERSDWRKKIIMRRKKEIVKKQFEDNRSSFIKSSENSANSELYKSALDQFKITILGWLYDAQEHHDVDDRALVSYIGEGLEKLKQDRILYKKLDPEDTEINLAVDVFGELKKYVTMQKYINFSAIRDKMFLGQDRIDGISLLRTVNRLPDPNNNLKGDWLYPDEIEFLWEYEKNKKDSLVPKNSVCGLKVILDPSLIGGNIGDEFTSYVEKNIKQYWDSRQPFYFIFILGTMEHTVESKDKMTGTSGHWYPLTVYQDENQERFYRVMDSASSTNNRIKDKSVLRVIERLNLK